MTYEEYLNEIEDFDDVTKQELLADLENHLPLDNAAIMQQMGYGGFQDFLKMKSSANTMQLGETRRGMHNVSPVLTMGAISGSSTLAKDTYFIDSKSIDYNGIIVISDARTDPDEIKIVEKDFYYYPKSKNKKFAYHVKIFISTSAKKLEEAYKHTLGGEKELLIFVEDNSTDKASFIYGAVTVGSKLRENLLSTYESHVTENKNLISGILDSFVMETGYVIEEDFVKELLKNGKAEYPALKTISIIYTIIDFISFGAFTEVSNYGISLLLDEAIEFINKGKIEDHRWNPKAQETFDPKFYPIALEQSLDKLDDNELNKKIRTVIQDLTNSLQEYDSYFSTLFNIPVETKKNPKNITLNEVVYDAFKQVYQKCKNIIDNLENIDVYDVLKTGIRAWNAFVCGVWNSLVDAVTSLLDMIKMIINISTSSKELMKNLDTHLPRLVERVEEGLQNIENLDLGQLTLHFLQKAISASINIDLVHVAYFIGGFYGFIISLLIEVVIGILISGGVLSVAEIVRRLGQELFGFFTTFARGVKKAWQKSVKFVGKAIDEFIRILDALIDFLKQGKDEMRKMIDEIFDAFKLYSKETRSSLNMQLPFLGPAEIALQKRLMKAFYTGFKDLLLKYADVAKVMKTWKKLKPMGDLSKKDMEMMLEWRRKFVGEKKASNVAIMRQKVRVNGEVIELEYKAFATENAPGFCGNPNKDYIAKQLEMSMDELDLHYETLEEKGKMIRFKDSEHKIFAQNDHDLATLMAKHGKENVQVLENNFKSLYEPCPSCKKQIIIRQEMYKVEKLSVEAVRFNKNRYVVGNIEFLEAIKNLK
ncbi:hypothetical protein PGH12_01550 [Chryseobacterium wangxinyae]|uniref:hypothetical protein n=1 Tax=Chryseobacterium sp. CY350 TaxID=2997336 RepID=UPI00226F70FC|nr:hypothetical protein [Chryseobacterium sp. CY350]MCY0977134.1 hypothetical protein [Chryseobacterium sp. CY350]WBZ95845.1 hypothetical protein PGH12_01550 [Chryseobacterium sp. CY350]